jgi:hypothetical protein
MKVDISSDKKTDIVISALEERYASIHKIRERVQGICLWSLGLFAAAAGWLVQSRIHFHLSTALLIGAGTFLAYWVLRHRYFLDLEIGFKSQMRTAAKLEKALHLYTPRFFTEDDDSLYPEKWEEAGTKTADGNYFNKSYELMLVGLIIFFLALALKTCI